MQGLGKNSWLRYHFNGNDSRVNDKDNFSVEFNSTNTPTPILDFKDACLRVAEEIESTLNGRKLFVAMSGGCDSETVAKTFHYLKIPFTPIIHETYYL